MRFADTPDRRRVIDHLSANRHRLCSAEEIAIAVFDNCSARRVAQVHDILRVMQDLVADVGQMVLEVDIGPQRYALRDVARAHAKRITARDAQATRRPT